MRLKKASFKLLLMLAACSPAPPRTLAVKQWPRDEQIEIAKEHNLLADQRLSCLDGDGRAVRFPLMPAVLQEWEDTRRTLKGE